MVNLHHPQKHVKEISEVVDTDPSTRMSECSVDGDSKILINRLSAKESLSDKGSNLQDNAECSSLKKEEEKMKQERKHNYVQSNVIDRDIRYYYTRKRRRRSKHDHVEISYAVNNTLVQIDSSTQPLVDTCLNAHQSVKMDVKKEDVEEGGGVPSMDSTVAEQGNACTCLNAIKTEKQHGDEVRRSMKGGGSSMSNNLGNISLDISDEALASCYSKKMSEKGMSIGNSKLLSSDGSDGVLASEEGKKSSYVEPPSMEGKKRIEMESSEQIIDKSYVDASGSDMISEHHEKKVVEIQSNMKIENDVGLDIRQKEGLESHPSPEKVLTCRLKKKLLILDVNGILCHIVPYVPHGYEADIIIGHKAVFKRPFCDNFLQFCFERFNVGVWSSRTERNVDLALDFLLGKTKHNLLFYWDQRHCTDTGYNTVENRNKPLLLKEVKKLWEKDESNLPWERGEYNKSNTLLLDDSPYKALCNPLYTAVFPSSYHYNDVKDNSLGSGGDLRGYLEGLSFAENVQKYVEQNPFGQRAITERNLSWGFYTRVINAVKSKRKK